MGSQVSTIKAALSPEPNKKKGNKPEKEKIDILSFEVANVMSKTMQLWQSLSDQEILRLRTDVIKEEGVLNLVADSEPVLLSLACTEKLQDLTAIAGAVARLGKRCQEQVLQGFEHVYNDLLKQNIDVRSWEYSPREMEAKIKRMEQLISSTSNLYQELEILGELEQAIRRIGQVGEVETLSALESKTLWHRQVIGHLRDICLWNRTYDNVVRLLARTVCTIHGRIVNAFGSPLLGLSKFCPADSSDEIYRTPLSSVPVSSELVPVNMKLTPFKGLGSDMMNNSINRGHGNGVTSPVGNSFVSRVSPVVMDVHPTTHGSETSATSPNRSIYACYFPVYQNCLFSPTRGSMDFQSIPLEGSLYTGPRKLGPLLSHTAVVQGPLGAMPQQTIVRVGALQAGIACLNQNLRNKNFFFDPKNRHHYAAASTLGGAALALHYANVIIITEKMVKFPHLISRDSRDELYHMLPKSVRMSLRARLRVCTRGCSYDSVIAADWKEAVERILSWLTPLAHNMIRWQSEHNFEQQQVVARSNILLLQTLYFADKLKTEAAITEVLVGLNYIYGHDKEVRRANSLMAEYESPKDMDEYLEWQF